MTATLHEYDNPIVRPADVNPSKFALKLVESVFTLLLPLTLGTFSIHDCSNTPQQSIFFLR